MNRYDPLKIEQKWQKIWLENETFKAAEDKNRPKMFLAEMFPYPSGAGLHVGHVRNFTIVDVLARYYAQKGFNVLRPFGYDTFGLPAENYAIKTGISPKEATKTNIENFRKQAKKLGFAIDWSREINTSNPEYYRWTQWCFLQLYKKGLAYQKESYQWWCPVDKTVLANEQVENGRCWRCGHEVEKKKMKQWFFKITEYADELLKDIDSLDWPEKIKTMQKNWIGRSEGAEIDFKVFDEKDEKLLFEGDPQLLRGPSEKPREDGRDERPEKSNSRLSVKVFTTRPDTIHGATFLVLAPEHPLIPELITKETRQKVDQYRTKTLKKSEIERQENKEKTGVFTGSYAINPATNEKIPIWISDYVLMGYGTGAIMAVPAYDERDQAFAEKFNLPIIKAELCDFDDFGTKKVSYRMRDWLISRQRYWGCPIPIAYDKHGNPHPIPEDQLPVIIPDIEDYKPDDSGRSALAKAEDWLKVTIDGEEMTRETDTLDGYACSSWYIWRYASPHDEKHAWDEEAIKYWEPLDVYCGGDHAVAHLLYIRFWCKFFADQGLLPFREPVKKLLYNGYINAPDGKKMSKSKGNVIDPLEVVNSGYGADTLRTYEMFIGPYDLDAAWNPRAIGGVYRFLNRCWSLCFDGEANKKRSLRDHPQDDEDGASDPVTAGVASVRAKNDFIRHATIKKVTEDLERRSFNTAVAALMEYVNELYKTTPDTLDIVVLAKLLKPFAPHLASEMLEHLENNDTWPGYDSKYLISDTVEFVVQVNGKLRARLNILTDDLDNPEKLKKLALDDKNVRKFVGKTQPKKIIIPKNAKLINIVI